MSINTPEFPEDTNDAATATTINTTNNSQHQQLQQQSQQPVNGDDGRVISCSISSDEVNYLIFRYMQETGYVHSAFSFAHESLVGRTGLRIADRNVPPGALVSFLQKGLQYTGLEETLRQEQSSTTSSIKKIDQQQLQQQQQDQEHQPQDNDFSLLAPSTLSSLTSKLPPIQLNVPPSTAAAIVRAKWETESQRRKLLQVPQSQEFTENLTSENAFTNHHSSSNSNNSKAIMSVYPDSLTVAANGHAGSASSSDTNLAFSRQSLAAQTAAAVAITQLQQQMMSGNSGYSDNFPSQQQQQQQQQQRVAAELLALQQHQQQPNIAQSPLSTITATTTSVQQIEPPSSELTEASVLSMNTNNSNSQQQGIKRTASGTKRSIKKQKKDATVKKNKPSVQRQSVAMDLDNDTTKSIQRAKVPTKDTNQTRHGLINGKEDKAVIQVLDNEEIQRHNVNTDLTKANVDGNTAGASTQQTNAQVQDESVTSQSKSLKEQEAALKTAEEDRITDASPEEILTLDMHQSEVFMCSWNPIFTHLIATGSGDASARIWQVGGLHASEGLTTVKLLPHGIDPQDRKNKDVTTLDWSSDGTLLATGTYDGVARVWAQNGALIHTLKGHRGPIFSLKWNKKGNYLLSGSYDMTTIVWDVSGPTGVIQQQFREHTAPTLDVDWRDNVTFASCSTDKTVHICRVGSAKPLKIISGHEDEVNAVKWDPSGNLLASCSDDCTAKVWDIESDRTDPLYDFKSHQQEIYTVKWSPTGPGSRNPSKKPLLATASFDGLVRLWNIRDGSCFRVFSRHLESVYSVAFSPSGDFLASGSLAGQLYIWNIKESRHIKSYRGKGDIFEVAWNKEETRVAAAFSSNAVSIIDVDVRNQR